MGKELTQRYGKGFSETDLKCFRSFYIAYANRLPEIGHSLGDESVKGGRQIRQKPVKLVTGEQEWGQKGAME